MSGHSKWAKIHRQKGAADAKRANLFTKLSKNITLAARHGGDPEMNFALRLAVDKAKAASMPKDNIERAIKRASDKDQADYKEVVFEGYAPHGVAILIETATDNNTRTVANVRSYFNKCNGSLGTSGSVEFLFEHKCFFKITKGDNDLEELELELIDYGADEIFEEDDSILIYAPFEEFGNLQKGIESMDVEVINSGFERIPMDTKKLDGDQESEVDKLIEKLEEDDDVQNVFHNMA